MAKKSRKTRAKYRGPVSGKISAPAVPVAGRPIGETAPTSILSTRGLVNRRTSLSQGDIAERYKHISSEMKQIAIVAAVMFAAIVLLSILLQ